MDAIVSQYQKQIKAYLAITWADEETDSLVKGYIKRGVQYLRRIAGTELLFKEENPETQLLFDYCFYANNKALSEFDKNYLSELTSLNLDNQIKKNEGIDGEKESI